MRPREERRGVRQVGPGSKAARRCIFPNLSPTSPKHSALGLRRPWKFVATLSEREHSPPSMGPSTFVEGIQAVSKSEPTRIRAVLQPLGRGPGGQHQQFGVVEQCQFFVGSGTCSSSDDVTWSGTLDVTYPYTIGAPNLPEPAKSRPARHWSRRSRRGATALAARLAQVGPLAACHGFGQVLPRGCVLGRQRHFPPHHVRRLFRDHDRRCVGVPRRHRRHDRGIHHPQPAQPMHAQFRVDHRHRIAAHLAGAGRVKHRSAGCRA